jgi:protein-tyrosine phosphatase
VRKEYLEAAFQAIDSDYQGLENFLRNQLGADIDRLRALYTE